MNKLWFRFLVVLILFSLTLPVSSASATSQSQKDTRLTPGTRLPSFQLSRLKAPQIPGAWAALPEQFKGNEVNILLASASQVAAGAAHTCAVTAGGGVKCWGYNYQGQLGNGTTTDRLIPAAVVGLSAGIQAVAAGGAHTCALTTGGGVKCWGDNTYGQLGDGTITSRLTPVNVVGLSRGVKAIAAGGSHTCALTGGNGVKCWGSNSNGQLGDSTTTDRSIPVPVVGLSKGVLAITAGESHTCAVRYGVGVKCWGYNYHGQLGDGTTTDRNTPVDVVGLSSGEMAIAAGFDYTCAVTAVGGVKCWGAENGLTPADVVGLSSGVTTVAAGAYHTCALTTGGGIKCWGWNWTGQLGDGTRFDRSVPVVVVGLSSGVTVINAGSEHTCAVTAGGGVKCWGDNTYGQLGIDASGSWLTPVAVAGLSDIVTTISAGSLHTCALTSGGGVMCWGDNVSGQLGDGTNIMQPTPVDVVGLSSGVTAITAGGIYAKYLYYWGHTCALTAGGGVKCWGNNNFGQLGDGTTTERSTPVDVVGLSSGVMAIAAGGDHACALMAGGGVKCWGDNTYGQLGDGTTTNSLTPVDVVGLSSGVTALAGGLRHTCAVTAGGGAKCWGRNDYGQLGDGSTTEQHTPVDVVGLSSGVTAISAGAFHTCVMTSGGGVKCWGENYDGELGDGTTVDRHTPVDVIGLASGVTAVATGWYHTCALTSGGGVKCWGFNWAGQLGDGTTTSRSTPVDVVKLSSGVTGVVAGYAHTCSLTTEGGVQCWGDNYYGQVGNGILFYRTTPVDVVWYNATIYLPAVIKR
jgi:alpha-tubulin suppressor-like RCC1 family protein